MLLAYDLGTGGIKAVLYNFDGSLRAVAFVAYPTYYPRPGWHEQRPEDWWQAMVKATRLLFDDPGIHPNEIVACGVSGHSLGVVPIDRTGTLLRAETPIWSDSRASSQAEKFFLTVPESEWYKVTGNGFPPPLYSLFKILWYQENEPEMFAKIAKVIGTKDYINLRLCGAICTDFSYASGSGAYDLVGWQYSDRLLDASGLPRQIFPEVVASSQVIGTLSHSASEELGLPLSVKVVAGGVDNSCMALGARNLREGQIYNSLGSSSWIAVTSEQPLIDEKNRPFVFSHVIPGLFNSAVGVFSTGSTFRWVRDQICIDLVQRAELEDEDAYLYMDREAVHSPPGANGLVFHPNLAGGSSIDPSPQIRGALLNLDLRHTRADVLRAALEGIALQQRIALDLLRELTILGEEMIMVGGGSQSSVWRQIHADVYEMRILKTSIGQEAAAFGSAALAAVGAGIWQDFSPVEEIHHIESIHDPIDDNCRIYQRILPVFCYASQSLADLAGKLQNL